MARKEEPELSRKRLPPPLSKLGKAILKHVTEAAEECLDAEENYWECGPNVEELLRRFKQTPEALQKELWRLIRDDYVGVLVDPKKRWKPGTQLPPDALIFPSLSAMRGHPTFQKLEDNELRTMIDKLKRRPR